MTTQQNPQGEICLNLNHRITPFQKDSLSQFDLTRGIPRIASRAQAVVALIQCYLDDSQGDDLNPKILCDALESIRHDLKDLAVIGEALVSGGAI